MADPETGGLVNSARPPQSRGFFLYLCRMLNLATGVCSLLCLVAHAMAFFSDDSEDSTERPSRLKVRCTYCWLSLLVGAIVGLA